MISFISGAVKSVVDGWKLSRLANKVDIDEMHHMFTQGAEITLVHKGGPVLRVESFDDVTNGHNLIVDGDVLMATIKDYPRLYTVDVFDRVVVSAVGILRSIFSFHHTNIEKVYDSIEDAEISISDGGVRSLKIVFK